MITKRIHPKENITRYPSISGRRTILIVEDNEMNREILSWILSDRYDILQAENGAVGLEFLREHMNEISVVILDVNMPVMNGYEFLEQVHKNPFFAQIPVVVATANGNNDEELKCLALGAADFVTKPYNAEIIKSRIAGIIRLRESVATLSVLQTDELTGLYLLQAFYYFGREQIDRSPEKSFTVTVFDINRYKQLIEAQGEEAGNRLLHRIADILKDYTAASYIHTKFGIARFLLLTETMSQEATSAWIRDLFSRLSVACSLKSLSFTAGIYSDIDRTLPLPDVCDRAITALNSAGRHFESHYAFYDATLAEKESRLAALEEGMRDAYDKEQFLVYYQPKHDAKTGKLVGAEALLRWMHPRFGLLSPGEFIPLFEKNGFVRYADFYALKQTCCNLRKWQDAGLDCVPISINASTGDFAVENYLDIFQRPLTKYNISPSFIHIEVTESLFSDRIDEMSQVLQDCRNIGFSVELDDFGTGYSSLTALASLPLDIVKLDMSLMKNFGDEKKRKVLITCIDLIKKLGLKTVAEGVETEEQLMLLQQLGCDWIQGYFFSKPLPEEDFREYLRQHTGKESLTDLEYGR